MPKPKDKKDVQRFLGFATYVGRFIENLSAKTKPLTDIIKNEHVFQWRNEQTKAFENLKTLVVNQPTLQYFNAKKPITISVDTSKSGLGAVLLLDQKSCAYVSRAMKDTQERYAQIEKELLAICFGINKFYQYVYARMYSRNRS